MNIAVPRVEGTPLAPHAPARMRIADIVVHDDFAAALPAWNRLREGDVFASPFQSIAWVRLWHATAGAEAQPTIVVGLDSNGEPLFVLPFVRQRRGGAVVASFAGGSHSNFNIGVWRRDIAAEITEPELRDLLMEVARLKAIDLFDFTRQPPSWNGDANPFAKLSGRPAIDDIHALSFKGRGGTAVLETRLKPPMRGRLRGKETKLRRLSGYRYVRATVREDAERILKAFLTQKAAHFAMQGIANVFARPGMEEFIRCGCLDGLEDGASVIELHALEGGGEIIALLGGVADQTRFSCMFNSYTTGAAGRWSPGLILITHIIRHYADRGLSVFDLGPGQATYKHFFCKEPEHLFETLLAATPRGRLAALPMRAAYGLKHWVKSQPRLMAAAQRLRRKFRGRRMTTPSDFDD